MSLDVVRTHLGAPAYERDGVLIYQGDSLELLRKLPSSWLDSTVTSPPYNIGKEYETKLDLQEYLQWVESWAVEIGRISSESAHFWLNLGYVEVKGQGRAVPLPYLLWDKVPFYLRQEVVWAYGAGTTTSRAFAPRNEKFLWYVKDPDSYYFDLDSVRDPDVKYPNQRKNGKLKCNPLGKNPGDVWNIPKVTSGRQRASKERMPHPAQFPEAVIERIILSTTRPGDVVLDPFLGSGTTAAVAGRLGRRSVGFELRSDYLGTAIQRLDRMFDDRAALLAGVDDGELIRVDRAG
ncbi:site-specific DNA-methyltransferase [Curtobacterium sp. MCBD17_034]|uniref:DNA-methyltransferase n=1 Tax=unclassified Curtobacterium TaxID=257496 RepID=UPI000DA9628D|nr:MULTISPECIES: site-specific DNA-methyltransferase [unclassified Curtobacterium]PZF56893.1 site-specific DNA-methyltransferase [Curtobacterium sp. MCBD17_034]PZM33849.1 site-specific DNA-methyltransferase [Curtobacterium sp. MCBD17_031]